MGTTYYRQCRLQKGSSEQVSYLPERFCVVGKVLKLRNSDGNWDNGWVVITVGTSRVAEELLPDPHREIKQHRRNTGDAARRLRTDVRN